MDIDKYQKKLERQEKVQLGRFCAEWMEKVGNAFFESEQRDILSKLEFSLPGELVAVQARYQELQKFRARLASITNEGKQAERKLNEENRRV